MTGRPRRCPATSGDFRGDEDRPVLTIPKRQVLREYRYDKEFLIVRALHCQGQWNLSKEAISTALLNSVVPLPS